MSVLVVGPGEPVGALTAALGEAGVAAEAQRLGSAGGPSAEALADALVNLERLVLADSPEAIIAVGSGDAATAAALVAGKSGVRLFSLLAGGAEGLSDEASAVAELSSEWIEFPHDGPGVVRAAGEIADLLAAG